jgi:uncharacterized protein YndB with AHSA1/START domain
MTDGTRAFEMTIEVAVPPDAVWQALVDAQELVQWFPLDATISPGKGGKWMISWDGQWPWNTDIEIWEPNRHLRLVDRQSRPYDAEGKMQLAVTPMVIAIDWYIEGRGGTTTLRLVHSGFGRGGAWDDEFDGVSVGWQLVLNDLKRYLEHHRGQTRRLAWSRTVIAALSPTVWARLTSPSDGIVRDPKLLSLQPGDRYATTLSTGDRIEGTVLVTIPSRGVQMTVDGWNKAMYALWVDRAGSETAVNSSLTTYDMPESFVKDFDTRMRAEIDRIGGLVAA